MNQNSMLFWYPLVKDLVPTPATIFVRLDDFAITQAARVVGYPCFLRTDLTSGKHDWKNSCFVPDEASIPSHAAKVWQANERWQMLGIEPQAFVVREFLKLKTLFTAFEGSMPINKERRYFVEEGAVLCSHPYWEEKTFNNHPSRMADGADWKEFLGILSERGPDEKILDDYATIVAQKLGGAWSIDFAQDVMGKWWMLDMALAFNSYHQEHNG
jgi:hypothetical protein